MEFHCPLALGSDFCPLIKRAFMNFDKNTIIGMLLMLGLVIGFSWYNSPSPEEVAQQRMADSLAVVEAQRTAFVADSLKQAQALQAAMPDTVVRDSAYMANQLLMAQGQYGILAPATQGNPETVTVENNKWKLEFNTKGGMLQQVVLTDGYKRYWNHEPISMWEDSLSKMHLQLDLNGKGTFGSDAFYFVPSSTSVDARTQAADLTMRMNTADPSKYLELVYHFTPDNYAFDCKINVVGLGADLAKSPALQWDATGLANEKGISAERGKSSVFFREADEDRDYLRETSDDYKQLEAPMHWMAFKQDYFSAAVIAKSGSSFQNGSQISVHVPAEEDTLHTKMFAANLILPNTGANSSSDLTFFFGPNDYKVLKSLEVDEFDRIIDYGWSIIGMVNKYAVRPLFWFFSSFIGSFGLIILIVTLIIKMVLFPVTWKNFMSSAKMRVLKPEIDEINKKFEGKEAVEKQAAIMSLYRQTGVSPFAGCIPVLIQMPILYAMFRFFPAEIVLRGKSFLWADDLAAYDSILKLPFEIPFYGSHVSGFTLLMTLSTFVYTRMSMSAQPQMAQQPGMPNMNVMMNIFTFMMLFFFNSMPSGLSMYYFVANVISIGQMWAIKKYFIDEAAIRAKIEDNKKKPVKKSSFSQRLEQMQKEQQKRLATEKAKLKK
jgi:YidC/Oxa1 family membrane protein insertase